MCTFCIIYEFYDLFFVVPFCQDHAKASNHKPEIILNNFNTRLGHRLGRMFGALFDQVFFCNKLLVNQNKDGVA